jgi:hypothetical protein
VNGVAFIGGGCRWMTLANAEKHVSDDDSAKRIEQRETLVLARAIATRLNWKDQ